METLYDVLGVRADADDESIRTAFREAAKAYHPDLNRDDPNATLRFRQIVQASAVLRDAELRADYDRQLQVQRRRLWSEWTQTTIKWAIVSAVISAGIAGTGTLLAPKHAPIDVALNRVAARNATAAAVGAPNRPETDATPPQEAAVTTPASNGPEADAAAQETIATAPSPQLKSVPLWALDDLQIRVRPGVSGTLDLGILLADNDGAVLAERGVALRVKPRVAALPSGPAPREEATVEAAALALARRLVEQGDRSFAQGNIAQARQYFMRAVDLGLAIAALKMAETYDPNELARPSVFGVRPNPAEARRWYERAVELGVPEAQTRMQRLGAR
jgi:hypothetical protein